MNEELYLILDNEAIDDDGWALIAPFGSHPKTRVARVNGVPTEQRFIQVLDNESADALLSKENSFFRKLKRAVVGIPVYLGHPDLRRVAPETMANAAREDQIGVIDQVRKSGRGIEGRFVLSPDGAAAVENGAKFPSALWLVQPFGTDSSGAILARPFKLVSAGLTDRPNIAGVESLANQQDKMNDTLRPLIIGCLIAAGVALPNGVTDQQLVAIIANGDYPGHPFHGNQFTEGASGRSATNRASGKAHEASAAAAESGTGQAHHAAAVAHKNAAAEANKAGNKKLALYHGMMSEMHHSASLHMGPK